MFLRTMPDVRQVVSEASGHCLQREENERFVRVVREFVLTGEVASAVRGGRSRSHG
jgi:pimeloyl-ACP methyl ester carboxylesterase